jgi:hypothetical protein
MELGRYHAAPGTQRAPRGCGILRLTPRELAAFYPRAEHDRGLLSRQSTLHFLAGKEDASFGVGAVHPNLKEKLHTGVPDPVGQVIVGGYGRSGVICDLELPCQPPDGRHKQFEIEISARHDGAVEGPIHYSAESYHDLCSI